MDSDCPSFNAVDVITSEMMSIFNSSSSNEFMSSSAMNSESDSIVDDDSIQPITSFTEYVYSMFKDLDEKYYDDMFNNLSSWEKLLLDSVTDKKQIKVYLKVKYILDQYGIKFDEATTTEYMNFRKTYHVGKDTHIPTVMFKKDDEVYLSVRVYSSDDSALIFRLENTILLDVRRHRKLFNYDYSNSSSHPQIYFSTERKYNFPPKRYSGSVCKANTDRYLYRGVKALVNP